MEFLPRTGAFSRTFLEVVNCCVNVIVYLQLVELISRGIVHGTLAEVVGQVQVMKAVKDACERQVWQHGLLATERAVLTRMAWRPHK